MTLRSPEHSNRLELIALTCRTLLDVFANAAMDCGSSRDAWVDFSFRGTGMGVSNKENEEPAVLHGRLPVPASPAEKLSFRLFCDFLVLALSCCNHRSWDDKKITRTKVPADKATKQGRRKLLILSLRRLLYFNDSDCSMSLNWSTQPDTRIKDDLSRLDSQNLARKRSKQVQQ